MARPMPLRQRHVIGVTWLMAAGGRQHKASSGVCDVWSNHALTHALASATTHTTPLNRASIGSATAISRSLLRRSSCHKADATHMAFALPRKMQQEEMEELWRASK
jgi:hypothetical protein